MVFYISLFVIFKACRRFSMFFVLNEYRTEQSVQFKGSKPPYFLYIAKMASDLLLIMELINSLIRWHFFLQTFLLPAYYFLINTLYFSINLVLFLINVNKSYICILIVLLCCFWGIFEQLYLKIICSDLISIAVG